MEEDWRPEDYTAMQIRKSPVSDDGDLGTTYVLAKEHAVNVFPSACNQPVSQAQSFYPYPTTAAVVPAIAVSPISGPSYLPMGNTPTLDDDNFSITGPVMSTLQSPRDSEDSYRLRVSAQRAREPPKNENMRSIVTMKHAWRILQYFAGGPSGTSTWINMIGHTSARSQGVRRSKVSRISEAFFAINEKFTSRKLLSVFSVRTLIVIGAQVLASPGRKTSTSMFDDAIAIKLHLWMIRPPRQRHV